jgi:uncharacterized protein (TIGR02118 family)
MLYCSPQIPASFDAHYDQVHTPLAANLPGLRSYTVKCSRGSQNV